MVRSFDDLYIDAVRRAPGDTETGARERVFIFAIKFITMAMTLGNFELAI
jgi:hypothetical protein